MKKTNKQIMKMVNEILQHDTVGGFGANNTIRSELDGIWIEVVRDTLTEQTICKIKAIEQLMSLLQYNVEHEVKESEEMYKTMKEINSSNDVDEKTLELCKDVASSLPELIRTKKDFRENVSIDLIRLLDTMAKVSKEIINKLKEDEKVTKLIEKEVNKTLKNN